MGEGVHTIRWKKIMANSSVPVVRCVVVLSSVGCQTPLMSFCAVQEVSRMMVVCCN